MLASADGARALAYQRLTGIFGKINSMRGIFRSRIAMGWTEGEPALKLEPGDSTGTSRITLDDHESSDKPRLQQAKQEIQELAKNQQANPVFFCFTRHSKGYPAISFQV